MSEPCMCGAEDCRKCFPRDERKPAEIHGLHTYRAEAAENEWMDYLDQGYKEPRGL